MIALLRFSVAERENVCVVNSTYSNDYVTDWGATRTAVCFICAFALSLTQRLDLVRLSRDRPRRLRASCPTPCRLGSRSPATAHALQESVGRRLRRGALRAAELVAESERLGDLLDKRLVVLVRDPLRA